MAGILTTLPVIAFAGMGFLGPRLAHRFGEHRLVAVALVLATLGLVGRARPASRSGCSRCCRFLALAGGAHRKRADADSGQATFP